MYREGRKMEAEVGRSREVKKVIREKQRKGIQSKYRYLMEGNVTLEIS